ncbi:MAG TPA: sterol desaturase family protein [Saprospiraceae bacterium]|nr:sterol desaturase family protein [Saprospiraceae bacterium]
MSYHQTSTENRVFKNPILEKLTHTHIAYPLSIFYGTGVVLLGYTLYEGFIAPGASILLFFSGLLTFTLVEYLVHRYTFHMEVTSPRKERLQYVLHGAHHHFPKDKSRLAMPPIVSVILAAAFFLLYRLILGKYGIPFTGGFVAGYATYLCMHYSIHAFPPPKNIFKFLWIHHALHHYQQPNAAFGVSSPFWDVFFRTMPSKKNFSVKTKTGYIDDRQ